MAVVGRAHRLRRRVNSLRNVLFDWYQNVTGPALAEASQECYEREEEEHGTGEDAWLDRILRAHPISQVEASRRKWGEIDRKVAAEIHSQLDSMFPVETKS